VTPAPTGAEREEAGASARSVALAAVLLCLEGAYLSRAISQAVDSAGLEGHDRSLAADLAYGTVRRLLAIDARLSPMLAEPEKLPAAVRAALRIGAYELLWRGTPAYAAVSAWVDEVKAVSRRHAGVANAVLRRLAREAPAGEPDGDPDPERDLSLPAWLFDRFQAALGRDAAVAAARGMLEPEPLWLTAFDERAERALREQACEVRPGPELGLAEGAGEWPRSLSVRCPQPLAALRAFQEGLVQPQNPSSLHVARSLEARPGDLVYDLAAGQGIKTATLAASGARVVAVELSEKRSKAARKNLARLGLEVEHVVADLTQGWPPDGAEPGDKVILDAPCSGTGTLRGHPEIKLRLRSEDLERLAHTQAAMLRAAARVVKPGGVLLYAVCSLTPEEGVEQVEALLRSEPAFEPLPVMGLAEALVPARVGAYLLPVGGLDGFYLARLARAG
jgi:16S rRNA (cytosine967-C5)-methyltransferase